MATTRGNEISVDKVESQVCNTCQESYPLGEDHWYFISKSNRNLGFRPNCRKCVCDKQKARDSKPGAKRKKKIWQANHQEDLKIYLERHLYKPKRG